MKEGGMQIIVVPQGWRGEGWECPFCKRELPPGSEAVLRKGGEYEGEQDTDIVMCKSCAREHFGWEGERDENQTGQWQASGGGA